MEGDDILEAADFRDCVAFHGHVCPGLALGYRASKAGLERLKEGRAEDEEIVAITETDACGADAVQVLTGCTFGKGNFFYQDHGKFAFTFLSRRSEEGVRVTMKPTALDPSPRHRELLEKSQKGEADPEEKKELETLHLDRTREILSKPVEELFSVKTVKMSLPQKARIEPSRPCARCGEFAMASKLEIVGGDEVCRGCLSVGPTADA
jgi:formylmethanofuran dehydrogenase subunit E